MCFWVGEGRGRLEALISAYVHIVRLCIMYMHTCVIVHTWYIVLQATASNLPPLSSSIQQDPHSASPPGLSLPSRSFLREAALGRKRHLLSERMP